MKLQCLSLCSKQLYEWLLEGGEKGGSRYFIQGCRVGTCCQVCIYIKDIAHVLCTLHGRVCLAVITE